MGSWKSAVWRPTLDRDRWRDEQGIVLQKFIYLPRVREPAPASGYILVDADSCRILHTAHEAWVEQISEAVELIATYELNLLYASDGQRVVIRVAALEDRGGLKDFNRQMKDFCEPTQCVLKEALNTGSRRIPGAQASSGKNALEWRPRAQWPRGQRGRIAGDGARLYLQEQADVVDGYAERTLCGQVHPRWDRLASHDAIARFQTDEAAEGRRNSNRTSAVCAGSDWHHSGGQSGCGASA
jgi:hypothetical protein